MQLANMQLPTQNGNLGGSTRSPPQVGLRGDCWNSPLCPRNMPSNGSAQGIVSPGCGSIANNNSQTTRQPSPRSRLRNENNPAPASSNQMTHALMDSTVGTTEQGPPSMKRARTTTSSFNPIIKQDVSDETSPVETPASSVDSPKLGSANTGVKEKRLPHHVIERRYRENLNSQIESLRAAVPSTSSCLTLDMEDIGSNNVTSAIRPMSKAAVIAHAAEYMQQLAAQNEEVERMNRELRVTVEALRRLVNCEDCGVVQQIVDAGS